MIRKRIESFYLEFNQQFHYAFTVIISNQLRKSRFHYEQMIEIFFEITYKYLAT
jgi:hypothetical protein